jgi:biotin transport system substrate-specific component
MSSLSVKNFRPFIIHACSPQSWWCKLTITTVATLILALSANVSVPIQPVPLSLQSLAVLLVGACLGRKLGCLTIIEYLLLGATGLPFFAGGHGGVATLTSVSAGYLYGFIVCAYIAGLAAEKGYDRCFLRCLLSFAVAHQIIFVFGVTYLAYYKHISLLAAIKVGYLPFAGFDVVKFFFAAILMFYLWHRTTTGPALHGSTDPTL